MIGLLPFIAEPTPIPEEPEEGKVADVYKKVTDVE